MKSNQHFQPARALLALARLALLCACLCCLCACGLLTAKDTDQGAAAADAGSNGESAWGGDPVPYTVEIRMDGGPEDLASKMKDLSQLEQLREEPPDSLLGLERRCMRDQETAVKLLNSQCYYDGEAKFSIDESSKPVKAILTLIPGPRFTVGEASARYVPPPQIPKSFMHRERVIGFWGLEKEHLPAPKFPAQIPGVAIGEPIVADDMLAAVAKIPASLQQAAGAGAHLVHIARQPVRVRAGHGLNGIKHKQLGPCPCHAR